MLHMTRARRTLISPADTPYYHFIGRCVRRAFLCGRDAFSGRNYEHRKAWIADRLAQLARVFTIDVCAYAVMSNHYHLVVKLDPERAGELSDDEVLARWEQLFSPALLVERYRQGLTTGEAEAQQARTIIAGYRQRLGDLSWFMRCLNEHIARRANAEDDCTGRFWEGRYKSQALLDEAALLTCMSYVDLNPIRAGLADTPETSDFTSVQQRAQSVRLDHEIRPRVRQPHIPLLPFKEVESLRAPDHLPFTLHDYLALVDWAGRAVRETKPGVIPAGLPPILTRLGIAPAHYLKTQRRHHNHAFGIAMGCVDSLRRTAHNLGQRYIRGMTEARRLFPLTQT